MSNFVQSHAPSIIAGSVETGCSLARQFEIDSYVVMTTASDPVGQRIDLRDPLRGRCHRFINHHVARGFDNFEIGNMTVFLDPDFYQRGKLRPGGNDRGWLNPFTVKTIVQHAAVPAEFRCTTGAAGVSVSASRSSFATAALNRGRLLHRFFR